MIEINVGEINFFKLFTIELSQAEYFSLIDQMYNHQNIIFQEIQEIMNVRNLK